MYLAFVVIDLFWRFMSLMFGYGLGENHATSMKLSQLSRNTSAKAVLPSRYCATCLDKVKASTFAIACESCGKQITYSMHLMKAKGFAIPTTCNDCQMKEGSPFWLVV